MSVWVLAVIGSAVGGALILWNAVSKVKQASEVMLDQYAQMLDAVRAAREASARDTTHASAGDAD